MNDTILHVLCQSEKQIVFKKRGHFRGANLFYNLLEDCGLTNTLKNHSVHVLKRYENAPSIKVLSHNYISKLCIRNYICLVLSHE